MKLALVEASRCSRPSNHGLLRMLCKQLEVTVFASLLVSPWQQAARATDYVMHIVAQFGGYSREKEHAQLRLTSSQATSRAVRTFFLPPNWLR